MIPFQIHQYQKKQIIKSFNYYPSLSYQLNVSNLNLIKYFYNLILLNNLIQINYKKIFESSVIETNLLNQISNKSDLKKQDNKEILKKQIDKNQKQITEITKNLQLKKILNSQIKDLFDQKTQELINMQNQHKEDKGFENRKINAIFQNNKRINSEESELQFIQRQLDYYNQYKLEKEEQQKLELEQIEQYQKQLLFSNTYKAVNCQVSEDGKVVKESSSNWYYCLCEQVIPKIGKIVFAFQILSLSEGVFVGIGFRDVIQKNNYYHTGIGSYLMRNNGYSYSHHNEDENRKQQSFLFTTNDIIIIEVSIEQKYIKWTKQNNPQVTVQLQIDTSKSQELYPCLLIYNSKVQILEYPI